MCKFKYLNSLNNADSRVELERYVIEMFCYVITTTILSKQRICTVVIKITPVPYTFH